MLKTFNAFRIINAIYRVRKERKCRERLEQGVAEAGRAHRNSRKMTPRNSKSAFLQNPSRERCFYRRFEALKVDEESRVEDGHQLRCSYTL